MATHCSVLAWRIPGTGKPEGLLSMGSHRVGHDCSDLAAAAAAYIIHREGNDNPPQYSCLENPMDRETWWAAVHGVMGSRTWLSDSTHTYIIHASQQNTCAKLMLYRYFKTRGPSPVTPICLHITHMPGVAQAATFRGTVLKTVLSSDANWKFEVFLKSSSSLITP